MRRRGLVVVLALTCASCGGAHAKPVASSAPAPLAAPRVTPGELDATVLLADLPDRARKLGAGPLSIVAQGEAFEGERLGAFVDVPPELCLLTYARASTSVDDLDVAVFSDEGTPLALDEAPDAHPTVILCAPHPERVYVSAHMASGEGLVAVAAQLVPREHAVIVGRALGARGASGGGPRPADAWPGLDDGVRAHRAALGGEWEDFRKVALSVDARAATYVAFPIDADHCTDAVVLPGEEVALLDVEALDIEGRVIARAREGGRVRFLTVCSPIAFAGTLAIRPHLGRGLAAVVLGRARGEVARDLTARPDVVWAAPAAQLEAARSVRNAELAKRGYDRATVTTNGALQLGRRQSLKLDLRAVSSGACARVDVVAGAPLALVEGALWDDAGALVSSAEGSASMTLFACAPNASRLDLETRGRPGPFAVIVHPESWKDAAFAAHPLAASRMLARAAVGPDSMLEGSPRSARVVPLDAAHMLGWPESIAAHQCVRVAAGAEGDGSGLELRAFDDADPATELDRSASSDAVSATACAGEAPRTVRFELRATSGTLSVVIGARERSATK